VRGPIFTGAAGLRGAAGLVIHCLSPWMLLITASEAVEGRFHPVWRSGGAAGLTPCHVMNRLRSGTPRIALE
jgi:hypothetical protein